MSALWHALQSSPGTFAVACAILGLFIGSFLNVVILRLPVVLDRRWRRQCDELIATATPASRAPSKAASDGERFDLMVPRSRCPHCGHPIGVLENIPLVSYLWLRGKCSACGKRISLRYPLVETLTALLSAVVAWRFGPTVAGLGALALTWSLLALTFIDYDHQLLPDDLTLPLLWLGLLFNVTGAFVPLTSAVIGAAAGYLSLWLLYHGFRLLTGKEGMGYGDFKLLAALGAWVGWQQLPLIVLGASLVGAIVGLAFILIAGRDRHQPIPFGPFLCVAGWVALLWGEAVSGWYLHFARLST
jgi:leader peptidase (prepilin peptidase)/N-methyltransferase